eukprot:TRINITY_DN52280_c0_g1_i2.p2 TRINITY_DN52280_c0_g1~~TRINITY_DN52280_c0_g1_i2.p2  ORF type:complete len:155 (+),score=12.78 TRINITY_DN52280_c0_g1_i2:1424-1888(+)
MSKGRKIISPFSSQMVRQDDRKVCLKIGIKKARAGILRGLYFWIFSQFVENMLHAWLYSNNNNKQLQSSLGVGGVYYNYITYIMVCSVFGGMKMNLKYCTFCVTSVSNGRVVMFFDTYVCVLVLQMLQEWGRLLLEIDQKYIDKCESVGGRNVR